MRVDHKANSGVREEVVRSRGPLTHPQREQKTVDGCHSVIHVPVQGVAQGSEQDTHIRWQVHVFLRTEQKKEELLHELPVRTERGLCLMLRERLMVEVAEEQDKQTGR